MNTEKKINKKQKKFFEVIISKKENNEQVHTNIQQYQVNYNGKEIYINTLNKKKI